MALATLLGLCASIALAQPKAAGPQAAAPAPFELAGATLDGRKVSVNQMRGKVVMVFFWNTECAVCLQKMPELRANAAGWRNKPFELVLVSTDRRRSEVESYVATVRQTEPGMPPFPVLWAGDVGYADTLGARPKRLPLTIVVDAKGRVAVRHEGRIAPEAWDDVAELLP